MPTTITTVREYDDKGRVAKETRTEVRTPDPQPPLPRSPQDWWRQNPYWWQYPIVSSVSSVTPYDRQSDYILTN